MRLPFWTTKTTNIHSEHILHIDFPRQHLYVKAPQYDVICKLPAMLLTLALDGSEWSDSSPYLFLSRGRAHGTLQYQVMRTTEPVWTLCTR